jgi:hypothetical protein
VGTTGAAAIGVGAATFDLRDSPDDGCDRAPVDGDKTLIAIMPNADATMSMIPPAFDEISRLTRAHR